MYADVAANRFNSQIPEADAHQVIENELQRNAVVESVVNRLRAEDPMLDRILQPLVEW